MKREPCSTLLVAAAAVAVVAVAGCGATGPQPQAPDADRLAPERLYPLAEGNVWSYDVDDGSDLPTLAITRVVSAQGDRYEVSSNRSEPIVYELRQQGIYRPASGTWLLKAPIEPGATWPSRSGRTAEVVSVDTAVETPAGRFEHCVRVLERGDEAGRRMATVYCPGVGPVLVESRMQMEVSRMQAQVTAKLRGHALQ